MKIWIEGRAIGKARPRFSSRGVVHSETRYSHWKKDTVRQIRSLGLPLVLAPVKVDCWFVNFFSSDSDNLIGGILDAMVEAGVLQNDSSSFVVASSGSFCKVKKRRGEDKKVGVLVSVTPAQLEFLDLDALMNESKIA